VSFERIRIELYNAQQAHREFGVLWRAGKPWLLAGHRLHVELRAITRSLRQNAMFWSILTDLSKQVEWYGRKLNQEAWKDVLSAALYKQDAVPNLAGDGFVVLGRRTSEMTVAEMGELITLAHAFGDSKSVVWSRTSLGRDVPDEVAA
jgi:hypothetical protein